MRRTAAHFLRRMAPPPLCVGAAARIGNTARVDATIYRAISNKTPQPTPQAAPQATPQATSVASLPSQPARATARNYRNYANELRGFSATLQEGKMKKDVDGAAMLIDHYCKGLEDDKELSNNALSAIDGCLRPWLLTHERLFASLNMEFNFWGESKPPFAGRVAFFPDTSLKERERVVHVPVVDTPVAEEVSKQLSNSFSGVIVVTGESGGGKTMGSIVGSVMEDKHFALYLGSITWPSRTEKHTNDAYDKAIAALLLEVVSKMLGGKKFQAVDPDVTLSLIVDEMGSSHTALRSLCRLSVISATNTIKDAPNSASTNDATNTSKDAPNSAVTNDATNTSEGPPISTHGEELFVKLKTLLGSTVVRIIAVGTGCDDVTRQAGSHPDTYHTVRAGADDGNKLWGSFCKSKDFGEVAKMVLAATGGLDSDAVRKVPSGAATMKNGARLRGNARMAALMIMRVLGMSLDAIGLDKQPNAPQPNAPQPNAPQPNAPQPNAPQPNAPQPNAPQPNAPQPNAPQPNEAAGGEATSTTALASQAVVVAKAIQAQSVRRFVGLNALRQYSSDQRMAMCAVAFGVAMSHSDSPLTEECFDHLCCTTGLLTSHAVVTQNRAVAGREVEKYDGDVTLGDGERLIVEDHGARYRVSPAIAAMYLMEFGIAHRSASGDDFERFVVDYLMVAVPAAAAAAHLGLSCDELPPNGLFDLLVAAFRECSHGMLASIGKCVLSERCALEEAWSTEAAKGGKQLQVLIVQNAPGAPAADIFVLCKDKFALHVQCKSWQQAQEVGAELETMVASTTFPKQYPALVHCSADKKAAADFKATMPHDRVVVSTYPSDPAFVPLCVPSRAETAPETELRVAVFGDTRDALNINKQAPKRVRLAAVAGASSQQ